MNKILPLILCTTAMAAQGNAGFSQTPPTAIAGATMVAPVTNKIYDGPQYRFPIKTQYPSTMTVDGACGGEGCGFKFTFVPKNQGLDRANVHIYLPRGTKTAAEQAVSVTGSDGLLKNNRWIVTKLGTSTKHLAADWVKQVISFQTDDQETGEIILGEVGGQAVQVMYIYPDAMAQKFWPAAHVVLKNLTFAEDLLPLAASSEGPQVGEEPAPLCDRRRAPC